MTVEGEPKKKEDLDLSDRDVFIKELYKKIKEKTKKSGAKTRELSSEELSQDGSELIPPKEGILVEKNGNISVIMWGVRKDPHTYNGLPFVKFRDIGKDGFGEISVDWRGNMVMDFSVSVLEKGGGEDLMNWDPEKLRSPAGLKACVEVIGWARDQALSQDPA